MSLQNLVENSKSWILAKVKSVNVRSHFILALLTNFGALINYGTNILITRLLNPTEVATTAALQAIAPFLFSVFAFVPYALSYKVLIQKSSKIQQDRGVADTYYQGQLAAILWTLVLLIAVKPISSLFQLEERFIVTSILLIQLYKCILSFIISIAQGLEDFLSVGLRDIGLSLTKLIFVLLFFRIGLTGVWLPVAAEAAGVLIVFLHFKNRFKDHLSGSRKKVLSAFSSIKELARGSGMLIFSVALLGFMTSFDIFISKATLGSLESGIFSAASTLCRAIIFVSSSASVVTYVLVAKNQIIQSSQKSVKFLFYSCVFTILLGGAVGSLIWVFKNFLVLKLYGASYSMVISLLGSMIIYMLNLSVIQLLVNFLMAIKSRVSLVSVVPVYLGFTILWQNEKNKTMGELVNSLAGLTGMVLILLSFCIYLELNFRTHKRNQEVI